MKAILSISLAVLLVVSPSFTSLAVFNVTANPIDHEYLPIITINSSGYVIPQTPYINKTGNIYTLTGNLSQKYTIAIECSNIIFDGAGHQIDSSKTDYYNVGLKLQEVTNVTIQDLEIFVNNPNGIYLYNCSNCEITKVKTKQDVKLVYCDYNTVTENNLSLLLDDSDHNMIIKNTIDEVGIVESNSNIFFRNNLYCNISLEVTQDSSSWLIRSINSWDNGSLGNYWSDYTGLDTDGEGIGDTPYIIDDNNQDNYPLMTPTSTSEWIYEYRGFYIEQVGSNYVVSENYLETYISPLFSSIREAKEFIDSGPTSTPNLPPEFPVTIILASIVILSIAIIGVLAYFKKYKRKPR